MSIQTSQSFLISALFLVCSITLSGCDGSLDCPIDSPRCCDNILFGCGPFDLPQGCSCSSFRYAPKGRGVSAKSPTTKTNSFSGSYRVGLKQDTSNCQGFLKQVTGSIGVRESAGRITVTIPGFGVLRGQSSATELRASGIHKPLFSQCTAVAQVFMAAQSVGGATSAVVTMNCPQKGRSCSARYMGSAVKLG